MDWTNLPDKWGYLFLLSSLKIDVDCRSKAYGSMMPTYASKSPFEKRRALRIDRIVLSLI